MSSNVAQGKHFLLALWIEQHLWSHEYASWCNNLDLKERK